MQPAREQFGNGNELRDSRFAELDAQIQAEKSNLQRKPAARKRESQRTRPPLPRQVRREITHCARKLKRQHRKLFMADPKLKERAARFFRSLLPPQRKRGRPGIDSVTKAILLLKRFRRKHSAEKPEQIWKRVYTEA